MASDPRKLRPAELVRLLNSTPLGEVLTDRLLRKHRAAAGHAIGDEKTVDLLRYVAWLAAQRHAKPAVETPKRSEPTSAAAIEAYNALKERSRARNADLSATGREIGPLPPVADPARKEEARKSLKRMCEIYFATAFTLAWSQDHLKVIKKAQIAILEGGLFALAMPRGSGKTTLCEVIVIWALLFGFHKFVCLIGSDAKSAIDMLESIKTELESNELLAADFPEVLFAIGKLDGIANRASGQLHLGEHTNIGWTSREIVLPTIPDSPASGSVVRVAGITGRIRGMKYKRADGSNIRPTLVVPDDPQTDTSARSLGQCQKRESILAGAVLGLAGPGQKISGIMPCTVVRPGDMADRILNRAIHPEWNGERMKLIYEFPSNKKLWSDYAQIRADGLRAEDGGRAGTKFYKANRKAMDAGAVVAWPERFNKDELSAIQYAMNLRLQDEAAFFAEYQNEPVSDNDGAKELTAEQITARVNGYARGEIPAGADHLTAFVDVHQELLYYAGAAWSEEFDGAEFTYGAYPDQQREYYALADAQPKYADLTPKLGWEASLRAALTALCEQLLGRDWIRADGAAMRIERLLIDANWGDSTDVVYDFCRQSKYAAIVMPSHGSFYGAKTRPMAEYKRKRGDRIGQNWRVPAVAGSKRAVRHVTWDTNSWKSFLHARLGVAMGDRGGLALHGDDPRKHRLLGDHLTAEYRIAVEAKGRKVDEWQLRVSRDNHLFDCLVGCAVGASMQGCNLPAIGEGRSMPTKPKRRIKLSEIAARKRGQR